MPLDDYDKYLIAEFMRDTSPSGWLCSTMMWLR